MSLKKNCVIFVTMLIKIGTDKNQNLRKFKLQKNLRNHSFFFVFFYNFFLCMRSSWDFTLLFPRNCQSCSCVVLVSSQNKSNCILCMSYVKLYNKDFNNFNSNLLNELFILEWIFDCLTTGDYMKKVLLATWAHRDR